MKKHHLLVVVSAALFVVGWLVWNVLLVDSDLPPPAAPPSATSP